MPRAVVVRQPDTAATADGIRAFLRERLAGYTVPEYVDVRDELPPGSGKVWKAAVREHFA